jgi:hypothetical protein
MPSRVYPSLASSRASIKQIIILAVFCSLAIAAIILRISSRIFKGKKYELNDHAAFLALLFTTALAIVN